MSVRMQAAKAGGSAYRRAPAAGDPGLFGALGSIAKGALNVGLGVVTGGIGGGASALVKTIGQAKSNLAAGSGVIGSSPAIPRLTGGGNVPVPTTGGGGGGGGARVRIRGTRQGQANPWGVPLYHDTKPVSGGCPSGFHPNKSAYYRRTSDGGVVYVPKGALCVKNRSRNPLNPRALRRAVSRIDAGKVWQAKMAEISTAKYTASGKRKQR